MLILTILIMTLFVLVGLYFASESNGLPGAFFVPVGFGVFIVGVMWLGYWVGINNAINAI